MPTHNLTFEDLQSNGLPALSIELEKLCILNNYTNVLIEYISPIDDNHFSIDLTLSESDSKQTIISNLSNTTIPSLSVSQAMLSIAGDGSSTGVITVTDSRGTAAAGKIIEINSSIPILRCIVF